jgi:hypothetical protein
MKRRDGREGKMNGKKKKNEWEEYWILSLRESLSFLA